MGIKSFALEHPSDLWCANFEVAFEGAELRKTSVRKGAAKVIFHCVSDAGNCVEFVTTDIQGDELVPKDVWDCINLHMTDAWCIIGKDLAKAVVREIHENVGVGKTCWFVLKTNGALSQTFIGLIHFLQGVVVYAEGDTRDLHWGLNDAIEICDLPLKWHKGVTEMELSGRSDDHGYHTITTRLRKDQKYEDAYLNLDGIGERDNNIRIVDLPFKESEYPEPRTKFTNKGKGGYQKRA